MTGRDIAERPFADDVIQPFQIEASSLRGRLVKLGGLLDEILTRHDYPEPVAALLGETVMLAALLASALKYDGIFTLQTKGDGPLSLLVADITSVGDVRGYARFDAARLAALHRHGAGQGAPLLLGHGYLAFTVDQGPHTDRYQGIVQLSGATLADCVQHYFRQSEQLDAGIKLAVARGPDGWRAGGLMVQRLPPPDDARRALPSDREDDWRRAMVLMESATPAELLDPGLAPNDLLYRLFHEDGVRVYTPAALRAGCRCSRERVVAMLAALPRAEVESFQIDGRVEIQCEFCNTTYSFDANDIAAVYGG